MQNRVDLFHNEGIVPGLYNVCNVPICLLGDTYGAAASGSPL